MIVAILFTTIAEGKVLAKFVPGAGSIITPGAKNRAYVESLSGPFIEARDLFSAYPTTTEPYVQGAFLRRDDHQVHMMPALRTEHGHDGRLSWSNLSLNCSAAFRKSL
jgi:hypothetical protein